MKRNPFLSGLFLTALFTILLLWVYEPYLGSPMIYDSYTRIQARETEFRLGVATTLRIFPQRPLPMASFYLNYLLAGMDARCFRIGNALAYGLLAALVVLTMDLVLSLPGIHAAEERSKRLVSAGLGLLFLLHPVGVFVVVYIWQRICVLSGIFFMLALFLYISVRAGRISNQVVGYIAASLSFMLAMLSKENSITLPCVLILAEVAFFKLPHRELLRRAAALVLVVALCLAALSPLERPHGGGEHTGFLHTLKAYYLESGLSVVQVVLAECSVVFAYAKMVLLPVPSHVHLLEAQVVPQSLVDPPTTVLPILGILVLASLGVVLLDRRPLVGFGLLFYLGNLVPEALIVPQYLFCGYRVMVPMVGLLFVVADGVLVALQHRRMVLAAGFSLTAVLLSMVVGQKASLWRDPLVWWNDVRARLPASDRVEKHIRLQALANVGYQLQKEGRVQEAIPLLKEAMQVDEIVAYPYWVLGAAYRRLGDWKLAGETYRRLLAVYPQGAEGYAGLGAVLFAEKQYGPARAAYQKALDLAPLSPDYHYGLALVALMQEDRPAARAMLSRTLELNPGFAEAHYNLGKLLTAMGQADAGLSHFDACLAADPSLWMAQNARGITLARQGKLKEAEAAFTSVLAQRPGEPSAARNLAAIRAALEKK